MADAAFRYQQQLEKGEKVIVGVNKYVTEDDRPLEILRISAEVERQQKAELARRRAARDQRRVDAAVAALRQAAAGDENLIPRLVDAARAEATVGEMAAALKEVWGEYTEPPRF
jgi:methylmalonyl-CoA mutase, N-terminal domain